MIDVKLEKKREANRRWKRNNREKLRRTNVIYRENNKKKGINKSKEYYEKNKDKIRKYQQEYYKDNPDKVKAHTDWVKQKRLRVSGYKVNIGCQICGYRKCSDALDFHHSSSDNKIIDVNRLRERKWEDFLSEAKKCIVVCRNCHAEIHYKLRNNIV